MPAPVRNAVTLMNAAAAVIAVTLIVAAALIGGTKAALHTANPGLTAAQARDLNLLIALALVSGLIAIGLWLWLARANSQGRNWARILSTVLFGLATLELARPYPGRRLGHFVLGGQVQPVIHYGPGVAALALAAPALAWLAGLAAVWLLWRPAASAYFTSRADSASVTG